MDVRVVVEGDVLKSDYLIQQVIMELVIDLVMFTTNKQREEILRNANQLANVIIQYHQKKMSLSGLAHCFELVKISAPGFDVQLFGFDKRGILSLINRYLRKQASEVHEHEKTIEREEQGETMNFDEWKALRPKQASELQEKMRRMATKGTPKQGLSIETQKRLVLSHKYLSLGEYAQIHNLDVKQLEKEYKQKWYLEYEELPEKQKMFGIDAFMIFKSNKLLEQLNQAA